MNRIAANLDHGVSSPRRFILLPEEPAGGSSQGRRIRRYQLTSLGQGAGRSAGGSARRRGGPQPAAVPMTAGVRELAQQS
jgi:hypothetical protein